MPIDYKRVLAERRKHNEEIEKVLHEEVTEAPLVVIEN
jgi:hypothetical protein